MNLLIVGINHNSAPIELREKIAFTPEQLGDALHNLRRQARLSEVAILSTCNRTEIISVSGESDARQIVEWIAGYHQLEPLILKDSIYIKSGREAVHHAMRVASGLDSMVIGEPQILGQFKECFEAADTHNTLGPELYNLSQTTFRAAKRVRTETSIGQNSVSVASTAVTLSQQLFTNLAACKVLLIGAGDTIELVARHIHSAGVTDITIANRTLAKARQLAEMLGGRAIDLQSIPDKLIDSDIVIASTAAQLPIVGKGTVERALKKRKHRPILMVDLAVPRDIEPEVSELRDIYLYSIDDLQKIVNSNLSTRIEAAGEAENILAASLAEYRFYGEDRRAAETLIEFRAHHENIKQQELEKAITRLHKGDNPQDVLNTLANQLVNKIIHHPSVELKNAAREGKQDLIDAVKKIYQLTLSTDTTDTTDRTDRSGQASTADQSAGNTQQKRKDKSE